jgi:hypothetical protein
MSTPLPDTQLAEGHELYRSLVTRLRSNLTARMRRAGTGPATARIKELRDRITASVRIATAPDADAGELHRQWGEIAFLARRETEASAEMTERLAELAALLRPAPKDELLHRDSTGDALYAAPPRGQHGTLLFIRPGEGELYVPTAAVDALRAALKGEQPLAESETRAEVLREAADLLDRLAAAAETKAAERYGPASGIGPGSCDMVREAATELRHLADSGK